MSEELKTMPGYWTTKDLANKANVDPSYIRQLLLAGKIQGVKVAKTWFISDDEAARWLADRGKSK